MMTESELVALLRPMNRRQLKDLAARVGISDRQLDRIRRGESGVRASTLERISKIVDRRASRAELATPA